MSKRFLFFACPRLFRFFKEKEELCVWSRVVLTTDCVLTTGFACTAIFFLSFLVKYCNLQSVTPEHLQLVDL